MDNPRIEVHHLTKRFGTHTAVDALTFAVQPGVVTGFLGPNGAGKTTTLRVILGLAAPTGGGATIGGRRYADLAAPTRTVGALLDARAAHGARSAYHHLLCLAQATGLGRQRGAERPRRRRGDRHRGRTTIVPAAMALLGDAAWWLPRWLDRLMPSVDVEGEKLLRRLDDRPDITDPAPSAEPDAAPAALSHHAKG